MFFVLVNILLYFIVFCFGGFVYTDPEADETSAAP